MKLLLTGFDPFGGEPVNAAWEAARLVPEQIGTVQVVKAQLPTTFAGALPTLLAAIERERPDAVLCLGQASGRAGLTPERVGINLDDARIPDNAGEQPADRPIVPGGPAAYFTTLPVKAMVEAIRAEGLTASVSNTAGTFVCNHVLYGLLHALANQYPGARGGFVHVPCLPQQAAGHPDWPSMEAADIAHGITAAIGAIFAESFEGYSKE